MTSPSSASHLTDPAIERRVRDSFARQGLLAALGATVQSVEPGVVVLAMPYHADITQQHGYFHGGAIAALADSAGGYAALTLAPEGYEVVAVEFKISFFAPADGTRLEACGCVRRAGRLTTCLVEVAVERDGTVTPCAMALQTVARVPVPSGDQPAVT